MSIKFGWFDVPVGGDRTKYSYSADQMRDLWRAMLTNGIVPEVRQANSSTIVPQTQLGSSLAAGVGQGLNVIINAGIAFVDGAYAIVTLPVTVPIVAGWTNDIVFRLDLTGKDVVFGIFNKQRSASTMEAGLTRGGGIYEIGLHSVAVPAGATQVTSAMITDQRLNLKKGTDGLPCCGIVGSLLQPDISSWTDRARQQLTELLTQNQITFDQWFATVQNTLGKDIAGNLLNLIEQHKANAAVHITASERASWNSRATAAQGTKADAAMPRSGGDMAGSLRVVPTTWSDWSQVRNISVRPKGAAYPGGGEGAANGSFVFFYK